MCRGLYASPGDLAAAGPPRRTRAGRNRIPSLTTFDDQSPSMKGYTGQVTLPGYDNMTGLGVPNGQVFIQALRELG
jgi:hypothetical protein